MMQMGRVLVILAWAAFLGCLWLPSVRFHDGSVILGWKVALSAISEFPPLDKTLGDFLVFLSGIGNILIVLSPIALLVENRVVNSILAALGYLLFVIGLSYFQPNSGYATGYMLWVISFFVMGIGFTMLTITRPHNQHTQCAASRLGPR